MAEGQLIAFGKVSKDSVDYRPASGEKKQCGNCSMFRPKPHSDNGSCTLVAGLIAASAVCDEWARRK